MIITIISSAADADAESRGLQGLSCELLPRGGGGGDLRGTDREVSTLSGLKYRVHMGVRMMESEGERRG